MIILCLNTAGHENTLALVKDNHLIAEKTWISDRNETETILPNLEELLKNQNLNFDDLKALHVIQGVGGFTSLRVGISVVNTIAYTQNIKIYGSSVFELWSKRIKTKEDVAILIDAGKQECFYFSANNTEFSAPQIIANVDLTSLKEKLWVGEINDKQRLLLSQSEDFTNLSTTGEAFVQIDLTNKKPHQLIEPWYGREPNVSKAKSLF